MLTLLSPHRTALHRIAAGWKLAALAVATVGVVSLQSGPALSVALAVTVALYLAQGAGFARYGFAMLRPLWPILAVLAVWHIATGDTARGTLIAGRMLVTVALANLVTMTTRLDAMIAVMERVCAPLRRVGLNPTLVALSLALVIRFTPVLMERAEALGRAWRARSARRASWRIVVPLSLMALDDADHVAEALRARGGL